MFVLPRLHEVEARAGERRRVLLNGPSPQPFSRAARRGEGIGILLHALNLVRQHGNFGFAAGVAYAEGQDD